MDRWPLANWGIDLGKSGILDIAPDSPEWHQTFINRGLPPTVTVRSGGGDGHLHYYYKRPADLPLININKTNEYDIMPRGYAVAVGSLHKSGQRYQWETNYPWMDTEDLPDAPEWAIQAIRERWEASGKAANIEAPLLPGEIRKDLIQSHREWGRDRSTALYAEGVRLFQSGASPEDVVATLQEIDIDRGYNKYSKRFDGGIKEYTRIANKAGEYVKKEDDHFSIDEIRGMLGKALPKAFHKPYTPGPVYQETISAEEMKAYQKKVDQQQAEKQIHRDTLSEITCIANTSSGTPYTLSPTQRQKPGDTLWAEAEKVFPKVPGIKPIGVLSLLINEHSRRWKATTLFSHAWVDNRQNMQFMRRLYYYSIMPKIRRYDHWYTRDIPADGMSHDEAESYLESLQKTATRKGEHVIRFDNLSAAGCYHFLSSTQYEGFLPTATPEALVVTGLARVRCKEKGVKHIPIRGTRWIRRKEEIDRNENRYRLVAKAKSSELTMAEVEIDAQAAGLHPEYSEEMFKRDQATPGHLTGTYITLHEVLWMVKARGEPWVLMAFGKELLNEFLHEAIAV